MANPTIYKVTGTDGLNPETFIELVIPAPCNFYLLKNLGPDTAFLRSDAGDPNTEDELASGESEALVAAARPANWTRNNRYDESGDVLYYVKATGPLLLKCWL